MDESYRGDAKVVLGSPAHAFPDADILDFHVGWLWDTDKPEALVSVSRRHMLHQIDDFAAGGNGGLIISPAASAYLETILISAAQLRIPTVVGLFAREGALIGYEPLDAELFRRGAFFVDRVLRGAKPGDLPFEYPTRFELVVNLKTAKAIGITIPKTFLVRADEVIE